MDLRKATILLLISGILTSALGLAGWFDSSPASQSAFIDPALTASYENFLSVIVSGNQDLAARKAVRNIGGTITSDLWLIKAVAATIPVGKLQRLASSPGIISIVGNKAISAADYQSCLETSINGPCSREEGYVTDQRIRIADINLQGNQVTPHVLLPNGDVFSITDDGLYRFIHPDGTIYANGDLSGAGYTGPLAVGSDGGVFVAGSVSNDVVAINPDGTIRWEYIGSQGYPGGVLIGSNGAILALNVSGHLSAFDPADGALLWDYQAAYPKVYYLGVFVAPLGMSLDGVIYLLSDKGYVFAVDSDGNFLWSLAVLMASPYLLKPLVGDDGTIYLAGKTSWLTALHPDGSVKYNYRHNSIIVALPVVANDGGLFLPTTNKTLHAVNANGSARFITNLLSKASSSPVLNPDQTSVYLGTEGGTFYSVNTADGVILWTHQMAGPITSSPIIDAQGYLVVGSEGDDLTWLTLDGDVVFSTMVDDFISQAPLLVSPDSLAVRIGLDNLTFFSRLPSTWNGDPDVIPTDDPSIYKLVNPHNIDIGADRLHTTLISSNQYITGKSIGIAVIDSGIYFDKTVKDVFGSQIVQRFNGQADFVGDGLCNGTGTQYEDYCWYNLYDSRDKYGHGTHIAGIIWNIYRDYYTGTTLGVAPGANILSLRVLDNNGQGTYEDVIEGIQYAVANKDLYAIRIINMSLSATASLPYFVDPINRAVEAAWANGLVVLAAAGNTGPNAGSITVPGNDPYIVTVGAVNSMRTPGYWRDDIIPDWSSSGPTPDGFIKPDIVAPGSQIVSFMYNDPDDPTDGGETAVLALLHPDYSTTTSLFRMNGTSMATAVASGVVAMMLQVNPSLTPDEVKFRLMYTAQRVASSQEDSKFSLLRQGAGRLWAPSAVLDELPAGNGNAGMDILADLDHGWGYYDEFGEPVIDFADLAYHYIGAVRRALSVGNRYIVFYVINPDGSRVALGIADAMTKAWISPEVLTEEIIWSGGNMVWSGGNMVWSGGVLIWNAGELFDASGNMVWSGGNLVWSGDVLCDTSGNMVWSGADLFDASGNMVWSGGNMVWSGGNMVWSGGVLLWTADSLFDASGNMVWSGGNMVWSGGMLMTTEGDVIWSGGDLFDASGNMVWSGGNMVWSGGNMVWSGGNMVWSGGNMVWSGGNMVWSGGNMVWSGGMLLSSDGSNTNSFAPFFGFTPLLTSEFPMVWAGGSLNMTPADMVWSGGSLPWDWSDITGELDIQVLELFTDDWVNDGGIVEYHSLASPASYSLLSLTATAEAVDILVSWEISSDHYLLGFNLYRSETIDGPREFINSGLIVANHLMGIPGSQYYFVDGNIQPGTTYFYWLEAVDIFDTTFWDQSVQASALFPCFLPLMIKP